ncbi:MAG TPA: ester cyclase [Pyrinomonadaceae bacterium]
MTQTDTLEANKALMRRWFEEVWNKGRAEAISEMMSEECVNHGLSEDADKPLRGATGFLPFHAQFREAFPHIEVVVEDALAEGDKVAVRCSVRGKHEGDSLGFEATEALVEFDGIAIGRVENGMFVETWNSFDFARMYKQLGR